MAVGALREILARFGVSFDDAALKKGDKAVDGLADKLGKLGGLLAGGLILNGLKNMIFGLAEQADILAKQSAALGISTDELQQWQHAAVLSGASAEEFSGAFTKFNKNVADAAAGTGPAADALRTLGVSVKDSAGKLGAPIDLLDGVAAGLEKVQDPAKRTQAIMALFGKSGAKLIPLFSQGADGIKKMREEVEELGGGFSSDFAKRSEAMNDSITRLNLAWLSFKVRVGGLVIPLVERFAIMATRVTSKVNKWVDATGVLSEKSNLAAAAATVLGLAFFRAGLKAIIPWLPMIAAVAAAILVVDELITLWRGGDTVIGRAIDSIFGKGSSAKVVAFGHVIADMFTQAGTSSDDFYRVIDGVWRSIVLASSIAAETVRKTWTSVGATIYDALNDPLREAKNADIDKDIENVKQQAKLGSGNPEAREAWAKRRIAELEASKEKSQAEINEQISAQKAQEFLAQYERLAAQLDPKLHTPAAKSEAAMRATGLAGPGLPPGWSPPATVTAPATGAASVTNHVTVNLPAGTNPRDAQAIAAATKKAVVDSNASTIRAVAHTGG